MPHKSGFVNIIGKPNAGKSTLMNKLVGEDLSIITHKAQTTRHRIMGVVTGKDFQIVYSDTPGILKPSYKLHESMMKFVESALEDADILVYIVDIKDKERDEDIHAKINALNIPVIIVINKIDKSNEEELNQVVEHWHIKFPKARIIPVSALHSFNMEALIKNIVDLLPESPPFYDKDTLTDKTERFFASEMIREKIFLNYQQEIPYSSEVIVTEFKDEPKIVRILAYIFVSRDTQKAIILGHQGKSIKKIGTEARKDMEKWLGKKVFLELSVKVKKDWRDDEKMLRRMGYGE
jgi:GTP-binding protein Era